MTRLPALLLALALAGAALAYGAAAGGDLHFDDWSSIEANWKLRDLGRTLAVPPADLLGPERPVTDLTFALDLAWGGVSPLRLHLGSLALHLAAALLAFLLARGALAAAGHPRAPLLAALAAGAFALHPLQTESVAYAAQRAEVLASALGLAALLVLLAADAAATRARTAALSLAGALLLLLALGAKTVAVAYPLAFLLHRLVLGGPPGREASLRARAGRALAVAAPSLLLAAASVARNLAVLGPSASAGLGTGVGSWRYLLSQLEVHWLYLRLAAFPAGLTIDRGDWAASGPVPGLATAAAGLGLAALLGLALAGWREGARRPERAFLRVAAFGLLWWLLLLAPTSSVVPIDDLVAEHRTYLPLLGLLLAAAVLLDAAAARLAAPRARALALGGAVALLAALGLALAARAQVWRSSARLWGDAAAKRPGSFRAALNHAWALTRLREPSALTEYGRARRLARTPRDVAEVGRNLSVFHMQAGDAASALAAVDAGLAALPDDPELRVNRAGALGRLGRYPEAEAEARRAAALDPRAPTAHDTLGLALLAQDRALPALEAFRRARAIDPGEARYPQHELSALARLGRQGEACPLARDLAARGALPERLRQAAAALGCR